MAGTPKLNPQTIEQDVQNYFEHCRNSVREMELKNGDIKVRQEYPTMIGLALWLGISKARLYEILEDNTKGDSNKIILDTLSHARDVIESNTLQRCLTGDIPAPTGNLLLSSYGYNQPKETNEITIYIDGCNSNEWGK